MLCDGVRNKKTQKETVSRNRIVFCLFEIVFLVSMGFSISVRPRMRPMLAILEPIMFPSINPSALLRMAATEVNNSGAEVAIETMVKPTTTLGTPNPFAKFEL